MWRGIRVDCIISFRVTAVTAQRGAGMLCRVAVNENKTKPNTQLSVETNSNKFDICDRSKLFFNTLLHIPDSVGAELCELGLVEVYESGIFLVS